MKNEYLFGRIKLVVIIALIVGIVGALSFLIFGFTYLWQAMAATLMSILLAIMAVFFIFLSVYFWFKNFFLKREFKQIEEENIRLHKNLKNCNKKLREIKSEIK